MSFLDLQNRLTQTRKARKGTSNRRNYYDTPDNNYEFDLAVYHKALSVANKVVQHFCDAGEINSEEKVLVVFGDRTEKKENPNKSLVNENKILKKEVESLSKELAEFKAKFTHGGRKGYNDTIAHEVKNARANGETWRGLAMRLNISTATAQKLYRQTSQN